MSELQPVFTVTVALDGDDDPQLSLENVRTLLGGALMEIQTFGAIRSFTLEATA